jgi:hypothetical protein
MPKREDAPFFSLPGFEGRDIREVSFGELKLAVALVERLRKLTAPLAGAADDVRVLDVLPLQKAMEIGAIMGQLEELRRGKGRRRSARSKVTR